MRREEFFCFEITDMQTAEKGATTQHYKCVHLDSNDTTHSLSAL